MLKYPKQDVKELKLVPDLDMIENTIQGLPPTKETFSFFFLLGHGKKRTGAEAYGPPPPQRTGSSTWVNPVMAYI